MMISPIKFMTLTTLLVMTFFIIFLMFNKPHPVNLMMLLISYSVMIIITMYIKFNNSLILMLLMISIISGMMIMFLYFTSLLNNEKSSMKLSPMFWTLIIIIVIIILIFPKDNWLNHNPYWIYMNTDLMIMIYLNPWMFYTIINIMILIINLMFIIKMSAYKFKSLRKMKN